MKNYYRNINHKKYTSNSFGRDFFLGDLHGSFNLLTKLLKKVNFDFKKDRLFCTGDLIDRGESSFECLKLCEKDWFFSVLGNHETMLMEAMINSFRKEVWFRNGGQWWLGINEDERVFSGNIIKNKMPIAITVETNMGEVGVIHSFYPFDKWPLRDSEELSSSQIRSILWDRSVIIESKSIITEGVSIIFSGHTPIDEPRLLGNQLFIDTGCGHSANQKIKKPRLTMCEILSSSLIKFHHVDIKTYTTSEMTL